jgi:hypothetical protein
MYTEEDLLIWREKCTQLESQNDQLRDVVSFMRKDMEYLQATIEGAPDVVQKFIFFSKNF